MGTKTIQASIVLAAVTFSYQSPAIAFLSGGQTGSLERPTGDFILATMIGPESREPLDAAGRKRHAATGYMDCPAGRVSIHVVGSTGASPRVVVTTSHQFYDASCNLIETDACRVYFPHSKSSGPYKIRSESVRHSGGCSKKGDHRLDWSVFQLDRPVPGIEPYAIPDKGFIFQPGTDVLTVAAHSRNFKPYHQERCKIRERYRFTEYPLQSDCDNVWSSGSAHFLVSRLPRLVLSAIMVTETTTYGRLSGAEYDGAKHFNISVPLELDFLDAANETIESAKNRSRR